MSERPITSRNESNAGKAKLTGIVIKVNKKYNKAVIRCDQDRQTDLLSASAIKGLENFPENGQRYCYIRKKRFGRRSEAVQVTPNSSVSRNGSVLVKAKFFTEDKGFGFVTTQKGAEAFVHESVLRQAGIAIDYFKRSFKENFWFWARIDFGCKNGPRVSYISTRA